MIGDKVLKVGRPRKTFEIPNSKHILKPYVRCNFPINVGNEEVCIEVSDKVETLEENSYLLQEEIYELFKNLRDEGIFPIDIRLDNIGRLLKDNSPSWQNRDISESNSSFLGFIENPKMDKTVSQKGQLVILDTDYLYREEQITDDILNSASNFFLYLNERYLSEKKNLIRRLAFMRLLKIKLQLS